MSEPKMTKERLEKCREWDRHWWGSSMACTVCDKCLCFSCHKEGPCIPAVKSAQELVLEKFPNAFVDDDVDYVYIRLADFQEIKCSCGHIHQHKVTNYQKTLGSGGTAQSAWQSALEHITSIPQDSHTGHK